MHRLKRATCTDCSKMCVEKMRKEILLTKYTVKIHSTTRNVSSSVPISVVSIPLLNLIHLSWSLCQRKMETLYAGVIV